MRAPYKSAKTIVLHNKLSFAKTMLCTLVIACLLLVVFCQGIALWKLLQRLREAQRTIECETQKRRRVEERLQEIEANTLYILRTHPDGEGENLSMQTVRARKKRLNELYVNPTELHRLMHAARGAITMTVTELAT